MTFIPIRQVVRRVPYDHPDILNSVRETVPVQPEPEEKGGSPNAVAYNTHTSSLQSLNPAAPPFFNPSPSPQSYDISIDDSVENNMTSSPVSKQTSDDAASQHEKERIAKKILSDLVV